MSERHSRVDSARAKAPASVGNVAVGFDILGFSLNVAFDEVTATRSNVTGSQFIVSRANIVTIETITGTNHPLPKDSTRNTAAVAAQKLLEATGSPFAVSLHIHKGIPLSAGMGGSAASAVAAVVAVNALLPQPLPKEELLPFALAGEAVASGSMHADNIAPSLLGGIKLILPKNDVIDVPIPESIYCSLIHPALEVETKSARGVLRPDISLKTFTEQSAYIAAFIHSCHTNDLNLMRKCLRDVVIEPQRATLIPAFFAAKESALQAGAIGFSISGAGPSVFAWSDSPATAEKVKNAVQRAFLSANLDSEAWVAPISREGAQVI